MLWILTVGVQPVPFKAIRPTTVIKVRGAVLRRNDLLDAMGFTLPVKEKRKRHCAITCTLGSCSAVASDGSSVQCVCTEDGRPICRSYSRTSGPQEAHVEVPLKGPATIYDPAGRIVWTGTLNGHLPPLKGGIYFLRAGNSVRRVVVR